MPQLGGGCDGPADIEVITLLYYKDCGPSFGEVFSPKGGLVFCGMIRGDFR